jgi:nicotinamide-nucleotide amidase
LGLAWRRAVRPIAEPGRFPATCAKPDSFGREPRVRTKVPAVTLPGNPLAQNTFFLPLTVTDALSAAGGLLVRPACVAAASAVSDLKTLACRTLELAKRKTLSIVTAESCTAGKLSALLSEVPGAAEHLHGSFVTSTKESKTRTLGVPARLLVEQGAVAAAMAEGALARSPADIAASITGVASPDEDGNPVGRVCIAVARPGMAARRFEYNYGNPGRNAVQAQAMTDALKLFIATLEAS